MLRNIKVEFIIQGEVIKPFKDKFPKLLDFSDKQVATALIKDEFFKLNAKEYFNPKYYTPEDIQDIFFT